MTSGTKPDRAVVKNLLFRVEGTKGTPFAPFEAPCAGTEIDDFWVLDLVAHCPMELGAATLLVEQQLATHSSSFTKLTTAGYGVFLHVAIELSSVPVRFPAHILGELATRDIVLEIAKAE